MSATIRPTSTAGAGPRTLAAAALPSRVRHILEAVNALAAQSLTTSINLALNEFERQLFKQADRARSSQHQSEHFAELQRLRQHRADLVPRYLAGLETSLARLRGQGGTWKSTPVIRTQNGAHHYRLQFLEIDGKNQLGYETLIALDMQEAGYGWNIEMQMRAARAGLRILEIPVDYRRRRGGSSKVAGSLSGTVRAGSRILLTFLRVALSPRRSGEKP